LVVLAEFINNEWYVVQVDPATGNYMSYLQWPASHVDGGDLPAIGTMHDPYIFGDERLVIAQSRASTNKVRVQRYTYVGNGLMPREHTVECNTTHDMGLSGIAGGWLDFTTGDQHFVYSSNGGGSFYVMSEVGIQENNFNWTSEMSTGKVGFIYHDNKWQAMDKNGLMRVYTSINYDVSTTSTDLTKWVSLTYYRSGTAPNYQTTQSSRASITIPKRSQLTVTTPKLLASPGATDPNAVRIYVGKGATDPGRANMVYQGDVGYPVTAATFNALSTTNTDRPPTINDFPGATAAKLVGGTKRADGITPRVNVEGTGVAHIDGLIPPGTIMMWAGVTAPAGWALCDGSTVSRTGATADLAALFWDGTNYRFGNGNGTTTFNLPNFNNKLPIGAGTKALSTTGGSETKTIGTNNLPPHTHGVNRADGTGGNVNNVARGSATNVGDATTGNGGFANDPLNIMPPWLAISFIIKL
jgi:microcystin-dependent protein